MEITPSCELPPLQNPESQNAVNDLTNLSFLHEPAVLHNLKTRLVRKKVPFKNLGPSRLFFHYLVSGFELMICHSNGNLADYQCSSFFVCCQNIPLVLSRPITTKLMVLYFGANGFICGRHKDPIPHRYIMKLF